MIQPIITLPLVPPITMLAGLVHADSIMVEGHDRYQDQSLRNRCYLAHDKGAQLISLSVQHPTKVPYQEIVLADDGKVQIQKLEQTIQTAYGKAVYYEHYWPSLIAPWIKKAKSTNSLWELNTYMLPMWLKAVKIAAPVYYTENYSKATDNQWDWRNSFAKRKCDLAGIEPIVYHQTFGNEFEQGLSVIDLLMNEGPNSSAILHQMAKNFAFQQS